MNNLTDKEKELEAEFKELLEGFSRVLLAKLLDNERKYQFGDAWKSPDWEADLQAGLLEHIKKGDPKDVAIYALFAWYHNWRTSPIEPNTENAKKKLASQVASGLPVSNSLDGCPFHYCDSRPVCAERCRYDKQ